MRAQADKKLQKHHFIPCFYLKQWTGGDRMLCEFTRKGPRVRPRRTSTEGTGYVRGLYRLPNLPPDRANIIETAFMKVVDDGASLALWKMLDRNAGVSTLTNPMKVAWARFLYCMILRNPESLTGLDSHIRRHAEQTVESQREHYQKLRTSNDPVSFDEFKARFLADPLNTSAARYIHRLSDSRTIISKLCNMSWYVVEFANSPNLLLTSDRPIIMTNGIGIPGGHLAMPISTTQVFLATNDEKAYRSLRSMAPKELIIASNTKVVEQAHSYVYGRSDASLRFVEKRLGKRAPSTPLEETVLKCAS